MKYGSGLYLALFLICLFALSRTVSAQQGLSGLNPDRDKPLEITADQTLEWHRNQQQYIARGNVIVIQGDVTIFADTLTADYRETQSAAFEIYKLTAEGNVRISSQGNTAYGDKAVYNVDAGIALMTGKDLRMEAPDQSLTARDTFEYHVAQGQLTARGNARLQRGEDTLEADTVSAVFAEDGTGKRRLRRMDAEDNVVIKTPTETLTGDRGQYLADTNTASVTGNVKITRGPNILEGDRAEINLETNVSRLLAGPPMQSGSGGRVRGVFFPGTEEDGKPKALITPLDGDAAESPAGTTSQ